MDECLFDMPEPTPQKRKPFEKTQVYVCKRCNHSVHDKYGAYCNKFDLCIEFEGKQALLSKDASPITCNKKSWSY